MRARTLSVDVNEPEVETIFCTRAQDEFVAFIVEALVSWGAGTLDVTVRYVGNQYVVGNFVVEGT